MALFSNKHCHALHNTENIGTEGKCRFFREFPLSERRPTKRGYNICVVSTIAFAIIASKK